MKNLLAYLSVILLTATESFAQPATTPPAAAQPAPPITAQPEAVPAGASQPAPAQPAAGQPAAGRGGRRGGRGGASPTTQMVDGKSVSNDAFYKLGPDSMPMQGVPKGKWVGPTYIASNVFPGTQHTYWVYVPAQYDPSKPTPIMIFNDGQAFMKQPGDLQAQNVLDNLIFRREIPVMLGVFINPGRRPDQPEPPTPTGDWGDQTTNRPTEYNAPDDKYARVVTEELMPELKKRYNISPDPDLHGIMGASSGGCAAFGVAFFRPNDFRKVITIVGSFTDLRGEYIYPELVAAAPREPIRIFMQDGRNDNRAPTNLNRDWFYQSVRLMNALTAKGYEVNYAWGMNNHGQKMGGAILPDMLRWLWRDQAVDPDPNDTLERSFRAGMNPPVEIPGATDTPTPVPPDAPPAPPLAPAAAPTAIAAPAAGA